MAASGDAGTEPTTKPGKLHLSVDVPFPTARLATIALRSLSPDQEPRRGGVQKQLSVSGSTLSVWTADVARCLRVSVASFLDLLHLVVETMEQFDPEQPQEQ